ncbi:MAG TPA: HAMP domain-containing sensor histidine kinase [Candidatus Stackebrandtia faecavium]|nr:HAMP domain-containing sensor histidine kinase [Candidatus Stackebrandtia faecavium]
MSLFWRIFLSNAAVLCSAAVLLLVGPATVSTPALLTEAVIVFGGIVAMLGANAFLIRIGLAPLRRLTAAMTTADLLRPGQRTNVTGQAGVADVIRSFNTMLDRLEAERATSSARALSAQEAERRRIAQELHDEVGQTMTAVLLKLKQVSDKAPDPIGEDLLEVKERTRESLDEIRRIARRLRPGVLEELGLLSALKELISANSEHAKVVIHKHLDPGLPELDDETELVLYRVAQEGLTNIARHANATEVNLTLRRLGPGVELRIRDDGQGVRGAAEGAGIRGMRERALLIGADIDVFAAPDTGTVVRLYAPIRNRSNLS